MMGMRNRSGLLADSLPAGNSSHNPELLREVTGDDYNHKQFDIAARSAELCAAHGNGPNTSECCIGPNSPAPVETDRRPESPILASFVVATAPALLKGGPCNPTANQEAAEGELIKA